MKSRKKKHRLNLKRFIPFLLLIVALIACIIFLGSKIKSPEELSSGTNTEKKADDPKEKEYVSLTIRCAGDIMAHMSQIDGAKQSDGTYDFLPCFEYVSEYFKSADLSLANIETTFSGDGKYSGYPAFDAPDALAKNIKDAGIDVALFANNHMLDTKLAGAKRTVVVLEEAGLTVVGARTNTNSTRSKVVDVKGVKVGIVAYTYETSKVDGKRTLNGSSTSGMDNAAEYINTFRYYQFDTDKKKIADEIAWCRDEGAQVVICYLHWGNEYKTVPSDNDKKLASYLAENGADIIFASHPHVVQPFENIEDGTFEEVKGTDGAVSIVATSNSTPVFYSMGNFISNQRTESLSASQGTKVAAKTEEGIIAEVNLTVCKDDGSIVIDKATYIPTWVDRYSNGDLYDYRIIPLVEGFEKNPTLVKTGHVSRAKAALEDIKAVVGIK